MLRPPITPRIEPGHSGLPNPERLTAGRTLALLFLCVDVAACSHLDIKQRAKLQWAGPLVATVNVAQCPRTQGTLVLQNTQVIFAPDDGTWTLAGTVRSNTIEAARSRSLPNHQVYATELRASWTGNKVQGTYTTPICTYTVDLTRF